MSLVLKYNFEIVNYGDYLNEISCLRDELKVVYPTHEPKYLQSLAKIRKVNVILIYEDGILSGFIPLYLSRIKKLLRSAIVDIPSEVLVKDYEKMFRSLYLFVKRKYSIANFTFNYLDIHLHNSSNVLRSNGALKSEFATNVVDNSWRPSLSIRRNLKKAEKNNLYVIINPSTTNVYNFYKDCIVSSRARKGIFKYNEDEYNFMLILYNELTKKSIGKLILISDENGSVVSGSFIIFNNLVCTYYNAGSTFLGLKMGASYLSVYTGIKFALERNIEYDLFGSYTNKDENYKKLYSFKRQWGREISLDQYITSSNFLISFLIKNKLKPGYL